MLINQSDIFNQHIKGKWVVNRPQYKKYLLRKGEILIAKIGTLGENETFCRCMYVGDELNGQLVSSAFYRMSTVEAFHQAIYMHGLVVTMDFALFAIHNMEQSNAILIPSYYIHYLFLY